MRNSARELLTSGHRKFVVQDVDKAMRLDQFLARHVSGMSRGTARQVIELGGVHICGRRQRQCSRQLEPGNVVELFLDGMPLKPFQLGADEILWQDKYLLALNKPAGIETQPTPARFQGTLYAALLTYLRDPARPHVPPQIGMVQRLDRDTSGVMVFSIHQRSHRGLTEAFAGRQAHKRYLALIQGDPVADQAEIVSCLSRGRDNRVRSVARGGKEAVTRYRVLRRLEGAALLEIELLTGRSHQIRAHFAEAGHPLLGDCRYGGPMRLGEMELPRQMLHSSSLELLHPVTGAPLVVTAPLPPDMTRVLDALSAKPNR